MKDIQNALYLEVFDPDKLLDAFTGVADNILGGDCENGCDPNCDCDTCDCGGDCQCDPSCKCYGRHNGANGNGNAAPEATTAPSTNPTTAPSIPQTGDSSSTVGIAVAAVLMLSGIAVVATKKREE